MGVRFNVVCDVVGPYRFVVGMNVVRDVGPYRFCSGDERVEVSQGWPG